MAYNYETESLEIFESAEGHTFIKNLTSIPVTKPEEIALIFERGMDLRKSTEEKTAISNRCHTFFVFTIVKKENKVAPVKRFSLTIADLAGSGISIYLNDRAHC